MAMPLWPRVPILDHPDYGARLGSGQFCHVSSDSRRDWGTDGG